MDTRQDLLFGKVVIANKIVSKDQLKHCFKLQKEQNLSLPLILLRKNLLDEEKLQHLVDKYADKIYDTESQDPGEELVLCRLLLQQQVISSATLLQLRSQQQNSEATPSLAKLIFCQRLIPVKQFFEIYAQLGQESLSCPGCEKEFRLVRLMPGKKLRCKHCKTIFNIPTVEQEIARQAKSTVNLQIMEENVENPSTVVIPGYEVLAEIAQGGMGIIYRAQKEVTGQVVALKVLREAYRTSSEAKERFKREALTLKQKLSKHKNIVTVFDVGIEKETPYFTMEFIEGDPLSDILLKGAIPINRSVDILIKICDGLQYAHSKGIIHRDIKPSNILLDADDEPRITDFGLAKCMDSMTMVTRTGSMLGTPSYMAPEQAKGQLGLIGPRSDIYALGVLFYEMLTGHNPFKGESTVEIYQNILTTTPDPPSKFNSQINKKLDEICLKCLKKNSFQRYKTVDELTKELRRFRDGRPTWWSFRWRKREY